jgi:hypothetical protein
MAVRFSPALPASATDALGRRFEGRGSTLECGANRLARSWQRQPGEPFVGYDELWPAFSADHASWAGVVRDCGIEVPDITECELAYANPMTVEESWQRHGRLERLLVNWLGRHLSGEYLPPPEGVVTDATFRMPGRGRAAGTLTVSLETIAHEGPEPLVGTTLTARSAVDGAGLGAAKAFFDEAFEWIVRGYASLAPLEPDTSHRSRPVLS